MFKRIFTFIGFLLFLMVATLMATSENSLYPVDAIAVADGRAIDLFDDVTVPGVASTSKAEDSSHYGFDIMSELNIDSGISTFTRSGYFIRERGAGLWRNTNQMMPRLVLADSEPINYTDYVWSVGDRLTGSISTRD